MQSVPAGSESEEVAVQIPVEGKMDEHEHEDEQGMEKQLKQPQKILKKTAGSVACCIFRIPPSVFTVNKFAFYPQILSIGPLHQGRKHLQMIQEHKWRFLNDFLHRLGESLSAAGLCKSVASMESEIRESYSEYLNLSSSHLIEMMVLDGVFIVELLLKTRGLTPAVDTDDPIFNMKWIFPFITRDLLRLENQIPFFVPQAIFKIFTSSSEKVPPLHQLALEFFDYAFQRPREAIVNQPEMDCKHLLDLFRLSFLPRNKAKRNKNQKRRKRNYNNNNKVAGSGQLLPPVTKLRGMGIKVRGAQCAESFMDVKFKNGVLEIPVVTIDDFISCVLLNCIAFEQCYSNCTTHMTNYTAFMGCLITTAGDAEFMRERNIVDNYLGTNEDIAEFFHVVNKDVVVDVEGSFLGDLFVDVNSYCSMRRSVIWKVLNSSYFTHPFSVISLIAASLLLILTAIQTFFAAYSYWYPPT